MAFCFLFGKLVKMESHKRIRIISFVVGAAEGDIYILIVVA